MKATIQFFLFAVILISLSCNNNSDSHSGKLSDTSHKELVPASSGKSFSKSSLPADILYFIKPFTDTLRYTRFFTNVQVADTSFIHHLNRVLEAEPEKLSGPKKCLSEGKIQLPLGGDAFKVVYFSRLTTDCPYVYTIEEGMFHYYKMSEEFSAELDKLEGKAKEK